MDNEVDFKEIASRIIQDQNERWQKGDYVTVESYMEQYPRLCDDSDSFLDVAYNEYRLREVRRDGSPPPEPEEFFRRFPGISDELGRLFEVHRFFIPEIDPEVSPSARDWPDLAGYCIERELGRGGMGVVYEAFEASPPRWVAIKMIRDLAFSESQTFDRFERESSILAKFHHPHIVQVYRVGHHRARPYIVMELVRGGNLRDRLNGTPQPVRPAAELIQLLAQAVHHAHERQVIHRDLKPANILLDRGDRARGDDDPKQPGDGDVGELYGTPKLTDFGLAKRLDDQADASRSNLIVGSPYYMAPEQCSQNSDQIGPRTDVYATGAILYEMLTGRPPFKGTDLLDTLEMVRSQEPVAPSKLQPKVPRDLETICLKCLEKEPSQRYAQAQDLADDLGRFLRGEPIRARKTPFWERAWKWAKRRPAAAALVVSVVAAVGSLMGVSLWYNDRLSAQRNIAIIRGNEAAKERDQALANLRLARGAVDKYYTLVSLDPRLGDHDLENLRQELLRSAVAAYESFALQRGDDPEILSERGKVLGRLAEITAAIGTRTEALERFRQSLAVLEPLAARYPSVPEYQRALGVTLNNLGAEYSRGRDVELAERTYSRAREIRETLAKTDPSNRAFQGEVASTLGNLAILYQRAGRLAQAEAAFATALSLFQSVAAANPVDDEALKGVADTHGNMARLYEQTSRRKLAEEAHGNALSTRMELVARHPSNSKYLRNLAASYSNLSGFYEDAGQPLKAVAAFREAIRLQEDLVASHPTISAYQNELSKTYNNLGIFHGANQEAGPAETNLRRSLEIRERLVKRYPNVAEFEVDLAGTYDNLGRLYEMTSRVSEAEKSILEAQKIRRELVRTHPGIPEYQNSLANGCDNLGGIYHATGRDEEAETTYLEALSIRDDLVRRVPQVLDYQVGWSKAKNNLGTVYSSIGRFDLALASYTDALEKRRKLVEQNPGMPELRSLVGRGLDNLGTAHYTKGNFQQSESFYKQALEVRQGLVRDYPAKPAYRGDLAVNHNNLALACVKLGRMSDAEAALAQTIAILEGLIREQPKIGPFRHLMGSACNNLGSLCLNSGRKRMAAAIFRKGVEFTEVLVKDNPTVVDYQVSLGLLHGNLADTLRDALDQPLEALKSYDRAVSLLEAALKQNPNHAQALDELIKSRSERAHALCLLERYADSLADWDRAVGLAKGSRRATLEVDRRDGVLMAAATRDPNLEGRICFEHAREFSTRARDVLKELRAEVGRRDGAPAQPYIERALTQLRKSRKAGFLKRPEVLQRLKTDADFEPLRSLPGYRELFDMAVP